MESWEWNLEEFVRLATVGVNGLPPVVHHDSAADAQAERIILTATTGIEDPAGGNIFQTELEAELRTTTRDAAAEDAIFALFEKAMTNIPDVPAAIAFGTANLPGGVMLDNEESENARSDSKDTRKRSRKYKFFVGHS